MRSRLRAVMNAMVGCALVFALMQPAFDRNVPGAHAPTGISWAYENRTLSFDPQSRRAATRRGVSNTGVSGVM